MRQLPPIPPGWRLLGPDELLSVGDMWFNTNEHANRIDWTDVNGVDAEHVRDGYEADYFGQQYRWITPDKGKTIASAEKEWLNPWD